MRATTLMLTCLLGLAVASSSRAIVFFSIDPPSPTSVAGGGLESDVFLPGAVSIAAGGFGLVGAGVDNLNAMTATTGIGGPGILHFSVDRASIGLPVFFPDVASEFAAGQAAGDIYVTEDPLAGPRVPMQMLGWNQLMLGLLPAIPPGAAAVPPIDDVDALDLDYVAGAPPGLFALAAGHPYVGASGFAGCGGDLFGPGPAPAMPFAALGLGACADDVDALHVNVGTGDIWYSLAPGSPSLAVGSPLPPCFAAGCSPADLLLLPGGGLPAVLGAGAAALGLPPTDNVDAISFQPIACPIAVGDADGDGIDDSCDNCLGLITANGDTDVDGFGNTCDADHAPVFGVIGITDFGVFKGAFGGAFPVPPYDPHVDYTRVGTIGVTAFGVFKAQFLAGVPGPSGLACAGTPPCTH